MCKIVSHRKDIGFTLLELLVVLAILGGLTAIALPKLRLNEGARLRASAHTLVVDLRLSRDEAIRRGVVTALVTDESGYQLLPEGNRRMLPGGISLTLTLPDGQLVPAAAGEVRFFPDGSASGGRLDMRRGNVDAIHIDVRGFDGRVRLND